ncbi:cardiolipin synthase [Bacillus sp. SA1-12]|uniref:cardiolipin synthase n=1 Tax=Bacillus sp. SA1-12 TaxID=1455638 RepID=UPI0006252B69|nr:cardiolipin synthase [Bacillus sp. SA1-12]KKI93489.1 cardiolipin synthase [Bacillus sp. SA1-12]
MKKRRIEFLFVLIIIGSVYMIFFTNSSYLLKGCFLVLYGLIILTTIFSLMLENRTAHNTLLWMYVLIFLPVIGYIFYLYSGQLYLKGYLFQSKRKNDRDSLKNMSTKQQTPDILKLKEHQKCFVQYSQRVALTQMNMRTQTKVLTNGAETFTEMKKQLKKANHFIHIEYYIFRSDRLGKEIMDILIDKAKNGVEVRFIYDAVGSRSLLSKDIKRMKNAGVSVYSFLPIKYGFFNQKFNFRNHRKIIVIDGQIGFVGGLNVGIEYLGQDEEIGFWRDTHLMLEGEALQTLHSIFLLDWEYISNECLLDDPRYNTASSVEGDGLVHVVASGPDTQEDIISDMYYTMISCATKSIWIATPYFVPNESIRTALRIAAKKGVQVRVMVPEINDGFLTQYATRSYFPELLRCGVEIYSYQKGFLHQKIIIVDGDLASIGTANMDMRSFQLNFEVNAFLIEASTIQDLVADYEADINVSKRIRPVEFYKRSLIEKLKESIARLFSGVL